MEIFYISVMYGIPKIRILKVLELNGNFLQRKKNRLLAVPLKEGFAVQRMSADIKWSYMTLKSHIRLIVRKHSIRSFLLHRYKLREKNTECLGGSAALYLQ